jgi:hypothetical protein
VIPGLHVSYSFPTELGNIQRPGYFIIHALLGEVETGLELEAWNKRLVVLGMEADPPLWAPWLP